MTEVRELRDAVVSANTGADAIKRAPIVEYDTGIKCLRIGDISKKKKYKDWGFCEINEVDYKRYSLEKGDIIIARTGNTIGVNMLISQSLNAVYNNGLIRLKVDQKKYLPEYVFYNLQSYLYRGYIKSIAFGTTTQPNMQIDDFLNYEIFYSGIDEQNRIVHILAALDSKIELLRKQNQTLENIAETLFKRWFVDFKFPNEDGRPYKSSGGKIVASELGEIPEGWKAGTLGEEFHVIMGQSPPGSSYNEIESGMIFFQGRTDFGERFPSTRLYTTEPKKIAKKFDTLLSVRAPVGDINMAFSDCCIGRGLASIRNINKFYAYYKMKYFKPLLNVFESEGTVFGAINQNGLKGMDSIIPRKNAVEAFEKLITASELKILINTGNIRTLTNIRDALLPKLMSGQISVN